MRCVVLAIRPPTSLIIAQELSLCLQLIAGFSQNENQCIMKRLENGMGKKYYYTMYLYYSYCYLFFSFFFFFSTLFWVRVKSEVWCEVRSFRMKRSITRTPLLI